MNTRHKVAHSLALAFVISMAACVGNVGGAAGKDGEATACTTACCIPFTFDTGHSRLYLVGDQVAAYLVVGTDGTESAAGTFDVAIAVGGVTSQSYDVGAFLRPSAGQVDRADAAQRGLGYAEVAPLAASGLACGQSVTVDVDIRYAERDPATGKRVCADSGPGLRTSWHAVVECPACPTGYISMGDPCDHPALSNCGNPGGGSYCPSISFLSCTCATRGPDGQRTWQCSVC